MARSCPHLHRRPFRRRFIEEYASIILASALALLSIGPAAAQSPAMNQSPAVSAEAANLATVEACQAQMRRLAGLNKIFGDNYNPEHVHEFCVGEE
jgi:hypothetical protein